MAEEERVTVFMDDNAITGEGLCNMALPNI